MVACPIVTFCAHEVIFPEMKKYILILSLFATELCTAQTDTVRIQVPNECTYLMPSRYNVSTVSKSGDTVSRYTDSIRVGTQIINKNQQRYYLIVTDSSGNKRLEGNFFDYYADGHVITYDQKGRKFSEGDYKIERIRLSKDRMSVQTGIWYYYDTKGKRIRTQKYK